MAAKYNAMYKSLVRRTMTPETPQMGLSGVKPCVARYTPSQSDSLAGLVETRLALTHHFHG